MNYLVFGTSLSCGFGLLFTSYRRLFVMLFFAKVADDRVSGAFAFKTTQRVFQRFVFADSDRGHLFTPPSPNAFIPGGIIQNRGGVVNRLQALFKKICHFSSAKSELVPVFYHDLSRRLAGKELAAPCRKFPARLPKNLPRRPTKQPPQRCRINRYRTRFRYPSGKNCVFRFTRAASPSFARQE